MLDLSLAYENPLLIKEDEETRFLIISSDVLHSLGIPSLGMKLDANPGRISTRIVQSSNRGIFMGSCYELCGRGHSAMPIRILCF